jgi:hypothetical protein
MGRTGEAAEHLRSFLEAEPVSPEAPRVRAFLRGLEGDDGGHPPGVVGGGSW